MNPRQKQAHENALKCAAAYKRSEADLLDAIDVAERLRLFECFSLTSIYGYCMEKLGLTESVSYYFVAVARKSRKIPALRKAIEEGELTVPKAARVCSVLTEENQTEWIPKAAELSKKEIEREVAKASPEQPKRTVVKPVGDDATRMAVTASDAFMKKLERVRELESQRTSQASQVTQALEAGLDAYLKANDPLQKAERASKRKASFARADGIPAASRHAVNLRDRGECQADCNGKKCGERRWIHLHHIVSRAEGGSHAPENLITLCGFHHRLLHEQELPH